MKNRIRPAGILPRIEFLRRHPVWRSQYTAFVKAVSRLEIPPDSTALSVSCGDGTWDYLALTSNRNLTGMIATDVIPCPVRKQDIELLNTKGDWSFQQVAADKVLPLPDDCCRLVLHQDVVEHTARPYLLLRESYRVLEPGGYLLCGTPNIFRPANILKLLTGQLRFPSRLDPGLMNPGYMNPAVETKGMVHVQEFNQYQLATMIKEVGFEIVSLSRCFFGISFLKLCIRDFPADNLGGNLCQYLFLVARKGGRRRDHHGRHI